MDKANSENQKSAKTDEKSLSKTILIAEDDLFLSKLLSEKLERNGFKMIPASDGNQALEKIKDNKIDLLLLDLIMPNLDGFQVLSTLHESGSKINFPIIILSNLGQDKDIEESKKFGVTDYIVKSNMSIDDVVDKVKKVLSKKKK